MLKLIEGYKLPNGPVDGINIQAASLGGGFIMTIRTNGRDETLVFFDQKILTSYLLAVFNPPVLAQAQAPEAVSEPVVDPAKTKRLSKIGRPKGAKNKPKLNGAVAPEAPTDAPAEALAEAA